MGSPIQTSLDPQLLLAGRSHGKTRCQHHSAQQMAIGAASGTCISSRLTVIVPCYNEAPTVVELLRRVRSALPASQIIFVDDGSTDGSDSLVFSVVNELGIESILMPKNSGKGAAFRAGLECADREYTIPQDADLEYDPRDIPKLLAHAVESNMDAVYGSRYLESGCKGALTNYLGVKLLGIAIRIRSGKSLTDACTCYKLFRTHLLRSYALESDGFELCQEMNRQLFRTSNAHFIELPILYAPRTVEAGKKIRATDLIRGLAELSPRYRKREKTCP